MINSSDSQSQSEMRSSASNNDNSNKLIGIFLAVLLAVGSFFSGYYLSNADAQGEQSASLFNFFTQKDESVDNGESGADLDEFWQVWSLMDEKFANSSSTNEISREEKIRGAIEGLVESYGDPYSVYLPPVETAEFNENISGNFSGVGMEVGLRNNLITVISPLPDTPADNAGILAGDVIVEIDGESAEDMRVDEAVKLIRGEKGTEVVLTVFREGEQDFIDIPIIRDNIDIPTVETEQVDDIFIISLYSFNAVAESQTRKAMIEYIESDAEKLVVDLRGNPGGYLQSAVSIASYFLPSGKVVVKEHFGDPNQNKVLRSRGTQVQEFNPDNLVFLVDNGSASASEILAGAMMDHGVATVIGSQTFGKGSVQELVELDDGSSLKVTVARWLTPNDTSISEGGITPDIIITRTPAQRMSGEDPQKQTAIDFLNGLEVTSETLEDKLNNVDTSTQTTE